MRVEFLSLSVGLVLAATVAGNEKVPLAGGGLPDYRQKWAIIVGINDYSAGRGFSDLQYAANDAREFRGLLVDHFGYDDDHVLYLTDDVDEAERNYRSDNGRVLPIVDDKPTIEALQNAFVEWLEDKDLQTDDSVLVFFAGHGLRDNKKGSGFLAAANSAKNDKVNSCVPVEWLRTRLANADCGHKLVFLDCCFSGTLFDFDLGVPLAAQRVEVTSLAPKSDVDNFLGRPAFFGMTAGLGDQPVSDGEGKSRHSYFTRELLREMRERCDSNRDDHVFTFSDLAPRVQSAVAVASNRRNPPLPQMPMAGRLERGSGDFIFRQSMDAETPSELGESRRLASLARDRVEGDLDVAALLAIESNRVAGTAQGRSVLQSVLQQRPEVDLYLHFDDIDINCHLVRKGVAILGCGATASGRSGSVRAVDLDGRTLWDAALDQARASVIALCGGPNGVIGVGYETFDQKSGGVLVLDENGKTVWSRRFAAQQGAPTCIAMNGNGTLAVGLIGRADGTKPGNIVTFDGNQNWNKLGEVRFPRRTVWALSFIDRQLLVAGHDFRNDRGYVISVDSHDPSGAESLLLRLPEHRSARGLSKLSGDRWLVIDHFDYDEPVNLDAPVLGGLWMIDGHNETPLWQLDIKEGAPMNACVLPDKTLAVELFHLIISSDAERAVKLGSVLVLDDEGRLKEKARALMPEGPISGIASTEDGLLTASVSLPTESRSFLALLKPQLISSNQRRFRLERISFQRRIVASAWSPRGEMALAFEASSVHDQASSDVVLLSGVDHAKVLRKWSVKEGQVSCLAFGADGALVAGYRDFDREIHRGGVLVLRSDSQKVRHRSVSVGSVSTVAVADNGTIAIGYDIGTASGVMVWSGPDQDLVTLCSIDDGYPPEVACGPHSCIAVAYERQEGIGGVDLFFEDGRHTKIQIDNVVAVAFDDDQRLAVGYGVLSADEGHGGVKVYEWKERLEVVATSIVGEGPVNCVAWGANGTLAAGFRGFSGNSGVVLFDSEGRRLLPHALAVPEGVVRDLQYTRDSQLDVRYYQVEFDPDDGVIRFNGNLKTWLRTAGELANRGLTESERQQYLLGENR